MAKMLSKQSVKVARAAAQKVRELFGGVMDEFQFWHLGNDLLEPMPGAGSRSNLHRIVTYPLIEESCHNSQQFGAFSQLAVGRALSNDQAKALRHRMGRRQKLGTVCWHG